MKKTALKGLGYFAEGSVLEDELVMENIEAFPDEVAKTPEEAIAHYKKYDSGVFETEISIWLVMDGKPLWKLKQ